MVNKPTQKLKVGQFELARFEEEEVKDGDNTYTKETFSFQKSWKDGEEWKSSKMTIFPGDIPKIIALLQAQQQGMVKKEE